MISIIIPAYNSAHYLKYIVEDIAAQTYPDIELIIVNDGSTDNTLAVCHELATKFTIVKVYSTDNHGAFAARLFGVEKSLGEWIAFVDADDRIPKNALEQLIIEADKETDIIIGTMNLNNKKIFKHELIGCINQKEYIRALLDGRTSIGPCAKLYRRRLFNWDSLCIQEKIHQNEDLLMLILLAINASRIRILPDKIVYNYLFNENGASRQKLPLKEWFKLFSIMDDVIEKLPYSEDIRSSLISYKIRILYEQGVLKDNNFITVEPQLIKLKLEADELQLKECDKKKLSIILSPQKRVIIGYYATVMNSIKRIIKRILHYA